MPQQKIGRLALRVEGNLWTAYYARNSTMDGALFLGSIHMRLVQDKHRKAAFMNLMREAVSDILEDATGTRPTWPDDEQRAPEHERAGRA